MRIAVVHSYYSSRVPSGENVVVDLQIDALRRAGHEVAVVARHTDELEQARSYPLRAGWRAATGAGDSPLAELRAIDPDVVHLHNLFPNLGRTWVQRLEAPLVTTLHNYRPICPAATLFRDGHSCTICPDTHTRRAAVTYACFKDSRAQTLPVALGTRFERDPLLLRANRLVTLNDDMRATYARYGVPESRLVTVPNFVPSAPSGGQHEGDFWLFVGRLTHDKGIVELVRQWPVGRRLVVVGDGPQGADVRQLVRSAGTSDIEFLGQRPHDEVRDLLASARGLVFPSLWPEGLPTVYLEALSAGLPVLAWPQSVVGTLVAQHGTGIVATGAATAGSPGTLAEDLDRADAEFPHLHEHCRAVFDAHYTDAAWLRAIEAVYGDVRTDTAASR